MNPPTIPADGRSVVIVHFIAWSSQADARATCGVTGYLWPSDTDPDGVMQGGNPEAPVWFALSDCPDAVTCPTCRPAADAEIARQRTHDAEVEAAGGLEAWWAKQQARLDVLIAKRKGGRS